MPISEYFLNNFVMLFELVGLLIILFISVYLSKRIKIYTRVTVFLIFLSIAVTVLEGWTQTFESFSIWRAILTSFKYLIYPLVLVVLILLVSQNIKPLKRKWFILLFVPELIAAPLYFSSQATGLIFKFTTDNHYTGGPLTNLPYYIFAVYLVVFVTLNIIYLRSYSVRNRIIALYITLISAACVVIYLVVGKTDDYNPILTSSLVFYFLFIYIHRASVDPLTGLRNRQCFYQDISESETKITYVASIDMNDLKIINDTQGHAAGDEAIVKVADTLRANAGSKANCYRIGGDEFMILYRVENKQEMEERINKIKEALKNFEYPCAFGYAERKSGVSIEDTIKESDHCMYLNKAEMKNKK